MCVKKRKWLKYIFLLQLPTAYYRLISSHLCSPHLAHTKNMAFQHKFYAMRKIPHMWFFLIHTFTIKCRIAVRPHLQNNFPWSIFLFSILKFKMSRNMYKLCQKLRSGQNIPPSNQIWVSSKSLSQIKLLFLILGFWKKFSLKLF